MHPVVQRNWYLPETLVSITVGTTIEKNAFFVALRVNDKLKRDVTLDCDCQRGSLYKHLLSLHVYSSHTRCDTCHISAKANHFTTCSHATPSSHYYLGETYVDSCNIFIDA